MTADPRTLAVDLRRHSHVWRGGGDLHQQQIDAASFIESILPLWDAWVAANPPCQTCGGMGKVHDSIDTYEPCPTCPDSPGVQPFAEWVVKRVAPVPLDLSHPNEAYNATVIIDAYLSGAPNADGWHLIDNATGDLLRTIAEQSILRLRQIGGAR